MRTTENATLNFGSQSMNDGFYGQQAAMFSKNLAERYKLEHSRMKVTDEAEQMVISVGRLQALHMHGRSMLASKFNHVEFADLLSCFQSEIFFPASIEDMGGALADDSSTNQLLAKKVAKLSHLERYALADLLELSWHNQSDTQNVFEVAESLGLIFAMSAE